MRTRIRRGGWNLKKDFLTEEIREKYHKKIVKKSEKLKNKNRMS